MQQERPAGVQFPEQPRDSVARFDSRSSTTRQSGTVEEHGLLRGDPRGLEARQSTIATPSHLGSASPSETLSPLREYPHGLDARYLPKYAGSSSPSTMLNPKRAYRQRRKDPSCDACRERKVKCDATDTTSCTECSSRNVRCQFTKDTNRRMSSIKQVQDLEKQLQDVRQQLERFKASENYVEQESPSGTGMLDAAPEITDVSRSPRRMLKARAPHDLSVIRTQLSNIGRGLFKPPVTPLAVNDVDRCGWSSVHLPSQDSAQILLSAYFEIVHRRLPILQWSEFCSNFWTLYSRDHVSDPSKETLALCFSVLALGALFSADVEVQKSAENHITTAFTYMDAWNDTTGLEYLLAVFLSSIYLCEVNQKRTGWMLLGSAVQYAQDSGLHISGGQWSRTTTEIRRRVWYCLYVSERLLATEISRPMLISDEDCDTEYPESLLEEEAVPDQFHPQKPTLLKATIYVARLLQPLAQLCRSLCIPADAIRAFEMHLGNCMQMFPSDLRLGSNSPLDPLLVAPLIAFQNVRIVLHRHNLSPACSSEQRSHAIENCAIAAEDTAAVFSRCFDVQAPFEQLRDRLKMAATFSMCTHVWRCLLFLAFREAWAAFHMLVRFASIVGNSRPINASCGRHLSYFLDYLIAKHQQGVVGNLEEDADLTVLLSGDLQAGPSGWVWNNKETGAMSGQSLNNASSPERRPNPERLQSWDRPLSEEEMRQWGGWTRISQAARYLEQLQSSQNPQALPAQSLNQSSAVHQGPSQRTATDQGSGKDRSRMTIASITDQ